MLGEKSFNSGMIAATDMARYQIVWAVVRIILHIQDVMTLNLAYGKDVWQSGTANDGFPTLAVDGNTSTTGNPGVCSHTFDRANPWWIVDLGDIYPVSTIMMYNRGEDCCAGRLTNFTVEISSTRPVGENFTDFVLCYYQPDAVPKSGKEKAVCPQPIDGRYVKIQIYMSYHFRNGDNTVLSLCEVEIFKTPASHGHRRYSRVEQTWATGTLLSETMVRSAIECAGLCGRSQDCSAYNVERKSGLRRCQLLNELDVSNTENSGTPKSAMDWSHYFW